MPPPISPRQAGHSFRAYWPLTLLILVVYLVYLPFSGYAKLYYDALDYWFISIYFHHKGSISLLNYHNSLRGYVLPLLLFPFRIVQFYSGVPPIVFGRILGAISAALGFGWLSPALWQVVRGQAVPLSWPRRLAFAGLGFALWRDYFNFTLSDFPALWALGLGLLLLYRFRSFGWLMTAGVCIAAAYNIRPSYLIAAPFFVAVQWLAPYGNSRQRLVGAAALMLGAALVLAPQWAINRHQFGQNTPVVLSYIEALETNNLYREKMKWGLLHQKLETTLDRSYPDQMMIFRDVAGEQLIRDEQITWFASYADYFQLVLRHPFVFSKMYAQRLFNGLDVQYPTPYIRKIYVSSAGLAWLNYTVWFGAILVVLQTPFRRWPLRRWLVLAVLLVPCLPMLPMSMECRFLLPLHLLLYATLCFGWPAEWRFSTVSRRRLLLVAATYVVFIGLCFYASASAQATLEFGPRSLW
ncbi:hypothetical protein MTX78_09290 [Hymenobacter tibetensis]|uniref:Glycosyltransferase RgtA/B/C/D-like domain-containing protein n=1 Tax=Hymenobacter tibetensis TaxID=497967 RepID=A0ABY4D4A1_9BACT|nr:hypothetical protein [Hymenobacter tibetensis]UOG76779.1 hypothetical protein MTX78_09290 [Hymenobacter tibetensis]